MRAPPSATLLRLNSSRSTIETFMFPPSPPLPASPPSAMSRTIRLTPCYDGELPASSDLHALHHLKRLRCSRHHPFALPVQASASRNSLSAAAINRATPFFDPHHPPRYLTSIPLPDAAQVDYVQTPIYHYHMLTDNLLPAPPSINFQLSLVLLTYSCLLHLRRCTSVPAPFRAHHWTGRRCVYPSPADPQHNIFPIFGCAAEIHTPQPITWRHPCLAPAPTRSAIDPHLKPDKHIMPVAGFTVYSTTIPDTRLRPRCSPSALPAPDVPRSCRAHFSVTSTVSSTTPPRPSSNSPTLCTTDSRCVCAGVFAPLAPVLMLRATVFRSLSPLDEYTRAHCIRQAVSAAPIACSPFRLLDCARTATHRPPLPPTLRIPSISLRRSANAVARTHEAAAQPCFLCSASQFWPLQVHAAEGADALHFSTTLIC
ncbi:hypothetical protein B0H13DRAFT_2322526 [Mycena leptocephala]|nr:hypothetical protein B0H13DRAFT_2322526 [Mycena leptocephala]